MQLLWRHHPGSREDLRAPRIGRATRRWVGCSSWSFSEHGTCVERERSSRYSIWQNWPKWSQMDHLFIKHTACRMRFLNFGQATLLGPAENREETMLRHSKLDLKDALTTARHSVKLSVHLVVRVATGWFKTCPNSRIQIPWRCENTDLSLTYLSGWCWCQLSWDSLWNDNFCRNHAEVPSGEVRIAIQSFHSILGGVPQGGLMRLMSA